MSTIESTNSEKATCVVALSDDETASGCVLGAAEELKWYALRVFQNRSSAVLAEIERSGYESYVPTRLVEKSVFGRTTIVRQPLIASLVFVRATACYVERLSKDNMISATAYRRPGTNVPAEISDHEMDVFMLVTRAGADKVESVDAALAQGDRVRVTDGVFKGAEGYVARVHGAKRLIVAIEGVAAVALAYIPKGYLERVE
ncbi:MAG: UpxY family transcription antiterminator [Rikenellaceae bacterium]|nr:UpxY family transcription antiterminator [Rikenellaceae bacterium]